MKFKKNNEVQWEGVTNNPDIKKKVFVKNGEIPKVTIFGEAVFKPGQLANPHKHDTMYEVFYILEGELTFGVEGKEIKALKGDNIVVGPGEIHSQRNDTQSDAKLVYFGIAVD
ncbi:cupin domain-containing protein [archaeon]|jgi:quercetin dioxygenase-like cupin family protein|nr:cupin domain-containing protein [archaeon]MBT4396942.1 cupin domain-containing protein [archaeon]MBT4440933.1 cupin domain-containing protein [archaeon]